MGYVCSDPRRQPMAATGEQSMIDPSEAFVKYLYGLGWEMLTCTDECFHFTL